MQIALSVFGDAKKGSSIEISDATFGKEFNEALVHQVVVASLANERLGTKAFTSRSQVSGGGSKPWRQKGTGRARAGTSRSPLWRGGGKAFAATGEQNFKQKINKKMFKGAIKSILSELVRQERLQVVEEVSLAQPKTKELVSLLATMNIKQAMIVTTEIEQNLYLASRNIPLVTVREVSKLDPVSLIKYPNVIFTKSAIEKAQELWK